MTHAIDACSGCDHECLSCGAYVPQGGSACDTCLPIMERDVPEESSPSVVEGVVTPRPKPAGSGCSDKADPALSVCFRCGLVTFDGLHRTGFRDCYMDEVEAS